MSSDCLRIAVEGCGHGTLKAIYASVQKSCEIKGWDGIGLLIIGGDFQAVRNSTDLNCMAVPMKYREIGDFHEYYSGARVAPYLTVFVGGNHEASNHLYELYYGGWVAPNIYYLGAANVLRLGPLRIASLSGIWKGYNYKKQHHERLPYNSDDVRSIYHVREVDTRKLLQLRSQVDIGLSHDWPRGMEWLGDFKRLFKKKDLFEADALAGTLGSVAAKLVLDRLRPPYWFSAHLHIKYAAFVDHVESSKTKANGGGAVTLSETLPAADEAGGVQNQDEIDLDMDDEEVEGDGPITVVAPVKNTDEIDLDDDVDAAPEATPTDIEEAVDETVAQNREQPEISEDLRAQLPAAFSKPAPPAPAGPEPEHTIFNARTNFLALDKCLPNRHFLQLLEIPTTSSTSPLDDSSKGNPLRLSYDPEWLAITRAFSKHEPLVLGDPSAYAHPDRGRAHYAPLIDAELSWVQEHLVDEDLLTVPSNFEITAPVYDADQPVTTMETPKEYTNPQTVLYCKTLGIDNVFHASEEERAARMAKGPREEAERGGRGGGRGRGRGGRRGGGGGGRGGRGRGGGVRGFRGGRGGAGGSRGRGRDRGRG